MIDLHSHVLPGIDDGPPDTVGSVAMADAAAAAGIRTLVATPHVRADHPGVVPAELPGRVAELNELLRGYDLDVTVVPGAEVDATAAAEMDDDELRAVTLAGNGQDLLLETPYGPLPESFDELVHGLTGRGFRVVAAHPERSPALQADPARLGRLVGAGMLVQLTAVSLAGSRRSPARALALRALDEGWAHVLASDAHSARWRPPDLGRGLSAGRRLRPGAAAQLEWMVDDAPRAVLAGRALPPRPPGAPARRRRWMR